MGKKQVENTEEQPDTEVLATLFNISTNDQAIHYGTRSFTCADGLCITAQQGESGAGSLIQKYICDFAPGEMLVYHNVSNVYKKT